MSRQYEELHTTTVVLLEGVEVEAARFIAWDGSGYAASTGGLKDSIGISRSKSYQGAVAVGTAYSGIIELEEPVLAGDFLKPGADGKAAKGSGTDYCARARQAGDAGGFVEAVIYPHVHA